MSLHPITLTVNGETSTLEVPANRTLHQLLAEDLALLAYQLLTAASYELPVPIARMLLAVAARARTSRLGRS